MELIYLIYLPLKMLVVYCLLNGMHISCALCILTDCIPLVTLLSFQLADLLVMLLVKLSLLL